MTRFISVNLFFVILLVMSACTPAPSTSAPFSSTQAAYPPQILPTSTLPLPITAEAVFDMYLGIVDNTSRTRKMIGMSKSCLFANGSCNISTISDGSVANTSMLFWNPSGTQAWFYDLSSDALRSFKPEDQNRAFETIAELPLNYLLAAWSPDGKWVAVSVSDSPYEGHVVLVDANTHTNLDLTKIPTGLQFIIGWPNNQEVIVFVQKYQPINGSVEKQVIESSSVYSLNIHTQQVTALFDDAITMQSSFLSPDGNYLVVPKISQDGISASWQLVNLTDHKMSAINLQNGLPAWSPDGKWITTMQSGLDGSKMFVYRIDTQQTYKVFESDGYAQIMAWLPDNEYLLVKTYVPDYVTNKDKTPLYLLHISDGTVSEVNLPGFDSGVFIRLAFMAACAETLTSAP